MKRILSLLVLAIALPAQAEILDLSVGENNFRGSFAGPLSRFISDTNGQYDIGALIKPRTTEDLLELHTGVLLTGDAGAQDVDLAAGLGARLVYIGREDDSGGVLAFGGQVEGRIPSFNRFGLTGYAYYGPEVVSFGNLEDYTEFGVALDYELIRGGSVYLGYRKIDTTIGDTGQKEDLEVDSSAHIGFRLKF